MRVLPPLQPTDLIPEIEGEDIVLSWTRPATGLIDAFQVELREYQRSAWTRSETSGDSAAFTHEEPVPGVTYEYRVRSVNVGGVSDWTGVVSET